MEPGGDSIVLEEEIDPNYEPTEKEVLEYASWLGMDLDTEQDLFWIAREGLKAPLPENWKPCKTTDTEEIYYFNFASGQSTWDHPCDEYYRKVYDDHKKKRSSSSRGGGTTDGDERKKKEKEDVAELLGKKSGKKKKGTTTKLASAEPLGPPVLGRGASLGEKKPLPGLSSGKLKGLSSGNLGSVSSLRPAASLGRLKGETKDDADSTAVEDDEEEEAEEEVERRPSPRALSKPPLGSLLSKKALPTASSLSKSDNKAELDEMASGFGKKKQKLVEEHTKALRELEEEHDAKMAAQRKKAQQACDEVQEQEEAKLKQRRKDFDKKMNDIENQYDKDESNLLRERKEKLKRLESEMELTLSQKKQELERDQQKEIQRLQSRLDSTLQELKDDHEKQEKMLKQKSDGLSNAAALATELEKLKSELRRSETQAAESEMIRQAQIATEERYAAAVQEIQSLNKQLQEANSELASRQAQAADPSMTKREPVDCAECPLKARRIKQLEAELETEREQTKNDRDSVANLQQQLESLRVASEAERKAAVAAAGASGDAELVAQRQVETDLRRGLRNLETTHDAIVKELRDWKNKCASLEEQKDQLVAAAAKQMETHEPAPVACDAIQADELESLRSEIVELHDQAAVLTKTNAQIKDQLLKESNEKKQLREQLDNAVAADTLSQELSQKLDLQQREMETLQQRLEADIANKDLQLRVLHEQVHTEQHGAEQTKRRLEAEITRLENANRSLSAETSMLKRQMDERLSQLSQVGNAAEQQAAATVTEQKWEIEQLQSSLKLLTRDKEQLVARVRDVESELDAATQAKHQIEVERDNEAARAKKKDAEREAIQQKLSAVQEELDVQLEKTRAASSESADTRTQLSKLKFKEQAAQDKYAQLEEELKASEAKANSQQSEMERLTRDLRGRSLQLEEKASTLRDVQGEIELLSEQLNDAKRQLGEWRTRHQGSVSTLNGGAQGSGEVAELRLNVSELEAKVDALTLEKTQWMDKQRALTQKQLVAEVSLRSIEAERDRLADECHSVALDVAKWKERLEKKAKEAETLKADIFSATSEKELVELALSKERDEKREITAQKVQLEKTSKQLEATIESLMAQLAETETTAGRTVIETHAQQSKLKRVENELETTTRELRVTQDERDALATKSKQQAVEMVAVETRLRLLRSEKNEQNARAKASEDDVNRQAETLKRLELQLDERDARLRKESDEKENLIKQLSALRAEKEEVETDLLAMKRKSESVEARCKDHESAVSRGDFQLKLHVQQLEAERDGLATGKDRAEHHAKTLEKELLHASEALSVAKNEVEAARSRIKALTLERDELQTALLQTQQSSQTPSRGVAYGVSVKASGATTDAMLVRLQLADVNKSELEHHLADVATQLELATRRCSLAETRCRDQSVELESLHVEIASLRASMAKMHLSVLDTLPLVERLEYEHRKRTLKRDFSAQLRDFQEREEHSVMRQKARTRAQHEKQLEELVDELDAKKQRRVEYEEQVTVQMLTQLRSERDAQLKDMRKQMESELLQEERALMDRKERRLESVAATVRQAEDDERARLREQRLIRREQALVGEGEDGKADHVNGPEETNGGDVSPGQLRSTNTVHAQLKNHPMCRPVTASKLRQRNRSDDDSSEIDSSGSDRDVEQRQSRKRSKGQRDNVRRSRSRRHHEREIDRWRQRLAEETTLLAKATTLVADQKKELKKQAEKIKQDKLAWKREWANTDMDGSGGHRVSILHEIKAMIDHSAASWNTSMQQLRDRDDWIQKREIKLRKMGRALVSLRERTRRNRSRSLSRGRGDAKAVRFGSGSSSSSDDDGDNQAADSNAVLDKLARLDSELASDASEFSADNSWTAAVRPSASASYGFDRHDMYGGTGSYRHPLSMSLTDGKRLWDPTHTSLYRPSSLNVRSIPSASSMLGGSTSSRLSQQRVWPTTASRIMAQHRSQSSDVAVQRRVARWAHGREALQHAATKQASWLSSLYEEVQAYGDTCAQINAEAAAATPLCE